MRKLNQYVKIAEAADYLGISVGTLRKYADEGRIPVRVNPANSYRLFRQEDLDAFLAKTARPLTRRLKAR